MQCISRLLDTTYPKVVVREECFLCSCCCIDLFCISQEQLSTKRTYEEEEEEEREREGERNRDHLIWEYRLRHGVRISIS